MSNGHLYLHVWDVTSLNVAVPAASYAGQLHAFFIYDSTAAQCLQVASSFRYGTTNGWRQLNRGCYTAERLIDFVDWHDLPSPAGIGQLYSRIRRRVHADAADILWTWTLSPQGPVTRKCFDRCQLAKQTAIVSRMMTRISNSHFQLMPGFSDRIQAQTSCTLVCKWLIFVQFDTISVDSNSIWSVYIVYSIKSPLRISHYVYRTCI
jgi:hypothetical protein